MVGVSLLADRRGRVPFAFIGALLLLSSSVYAVALTPPEPTEPAVDEVATDAQVEARMALEAAVRRADRQAAARPVLDPADSDLGDALGEEQPFERALELRIAVAARAALESASVERDSLSAAVTLPPIEDEADARRALSNVTVSTVGTNRYRVRIDGLSVAIARHDRPIDRRRYNATITTELPSLELHDRTTRFDRRASAGLGEPGLSRGLTARLFPIVWMRGYAQYGGAPIKNVLANRHVEVMANDALLAQQAAVFGTEDPEGRTATGRAAAAVATRDLFLGAEETVKAQLGKHPGEEPGTEQSPSGPAVPVPSVVSAEQSVNANHTVDAAYLDAVEGRSGRSVREVVDRVYRGAVRLERSASLVDTDRNAAGEPPENGTYLFTQTDSDRWLEGGDWRSGRGRTLRQYSGRVVEETVRTRYYFVNGSWATTRAVTRRTHRVRLDIRGRYAPPGIAPDRPEDEMPFGSTARRRLTERAESVLLSGADASDHAFAAVDGRGGTGWQTVDVAPPDAAVQRALRETAALRERTREVSVSMETRSMASSTNPASKLRSAIERDRERLLDVPWRYDSVADRAVVAARTTFLDRVTDRLGSKTPMIQKAQNALSEKLSGAMVPTSAPDRAEPSQDTYVAEIDGGPAYLSADPADGSSPHLAARNVNIFTVPYGDAADAIAEQVDVGRTGVSLRTAAQTLAVLEAQEPGVEANLDPLRRELGDAVEATQDEYRSVLAPAIGYEAADSLVDSVARSYPSRSARALAIVEGRYASRLGESLPTDLPRTERDRLAVALRVGTADAREDRSLRVSERLVDRARTAATESAGAIGTEAWKAAGTKQAKTVWKEATGKDEVGSLPAGLPLVPVPGAWYATANAWTVSVEGQYEQFAVRARRGSPTPNGTIEYVREDRTVTLDVDGDGREERLGHNRALTVSARTGVVVVVPPGGTGVGDVDGQAIETSPGW